MKKLIVIGLVVMNGTMFAMESLPFPEPPSDEVRIDLSITNNNDEAKKSDQDDIPGMLTVAKPVKPQSTFSTYTSLMTLSCKNVSDDQECKISFGGIIVCTMCVCVLIPLYYVYNQQMEEAS